MSEVSAELFSQIINIHLKRDEDENKVTKINTQLINLIIAK